MIEAKKFKKRPVVIEAMQRARLTVQVSTKLNRSHLVCGQTALILLGLILFVITFIVLAASKFMIMRLAKNEGAR